MASGYIPSKDANLALWALNFSALITANPAAAGLAAGDATSIATYVNAFNAALTTASNPATRTKNSVAAKDGAKAAMLDIVRPYAQQIKANLGVSNDLKTQLGLKLDDTSKTEVQAPVTQPLLSIVGATPLNLTIRYADAAAPDKRSKPAGAIGLQLFVFIGMSAPTGPKDAAFYAMVTKQPFDVAFDAADAGKKAYFYGRWQTRTGKVGPWSGAVGMTIASS